jgi:hypothetical protein
MTMILRRDCKRTTVRWSELGVRFRSILLSGPAVDQPTPRQVSSAVQALLKHENPLMGRQCIDLVEDVGIRH